MKNVVVIGCGASGVICAIYLAKKGNKVTILEKNDKPLKKLLITGNGKCNYFNDYQDLSNYNSSSKELIKYVIEEKYLDEIKDFFLKIGIVPKIKNGYYYPNTNLAVTVKEALLKELELKNVNIVNNYLVESIEKKDNKFIINNDKSFDNVVIATGSNSHVSNYNGYELLKKLNHNIIKPLPSLVQLIGNETFFKDWDKIRLDVKVTHFEDNKEIDSQIGEIQLTDYGVSGICIFNLSSKIIRGLDNNKKENIKIDFVPFIDDLKQYLFVRNNNMPNRNIMELLEGIINYKLVKVILKRSNIKENDYLTNLSNKKIDDLINNLKEFDLSIKSYKSFENSQVTQGGLDLNEIDLSKMESKKVKGLYVIGEIIDIDGICGGYNLTNAWITGIKAGKSI